MKPETRNPKPPASTVYRLQNRAIHEARRQLENQGVLDPWDGLNQVRAIAGELNLGIQSISRLSLMQRRVLIDKLIALGARVRNPHIYASDLKRRSHHGAHEGHEERKIVLFSEPKESQLRMLDTLASRIAWREPDGYLRLCHKLLKSPRPRNSREVTKLKIVLESMLHEAQAS